MDWKTLMFKQKKIEADYQKANAQEERTHFKTVMALLMLVQVFIIIQRILKHDDLINIARAIAVLFLQLISYFVVLYCSQKLGCWVISFFTLQLSIFQAQTIMTDTPQSVSQVYLIGFYECFFINSLLGFSQFFNSSITKALILIVKLFLIRIDTYQTLPIMILLLLFDTLSTYKVQKQKRNLFLQKYKDKQNDETWKYISSQPFLILEYDKQNIRYNHIESGCLKEFHSKYQTGNPDDHMKDILRTLLVQKNTNLESYLIDKIQNQHEIKFQGEVIVKNLDKKELIVKFSITIIEKPKIVLSFENNLEQQNRHLNQIHQNLYQCFKQQKKILMNFFQNSCIYHKKIDQFINSNCLTTRSNMIKYREFNRQSGRIIYNSQTRLLNLHFLLKSEYKLKINSFDMVQQFIKIRKVYDYLQFYNKEHVVSQSDKFLIQLLLLNLISFKTKGHLKMNWKIITQTNLNCILIIIPFSDASKSIIHSKVIKKILRYIGPIDQIQVNHSSQEFILCLFKDLKQIFEE